MLVLGTPFRHLSWMNFFLWVLNEGGSHIMMTYIRDDIAQATHLGQWHLLKENLTATMRSTLDSTPCHEIEPPSWPQPQWWVSFMSFESLYGQMNLVWILLFLAFISYCVVDAFHCSRQAQFSPLVLLIIVACVCLHFFMCSALCVCARMRIPGFGSRKLMFGVFLSCCLLWNRVSWCLP